MKRKHIIWIICIVLLGLMGLQLFANKQKIDEKSDVQDTEPILIPVKTDTITEIPVNLSIIKTGNLAPFKESTVLLPIGGIVKQINFELGDKVRNGQTLAVIDSRTNQLELDKVETQIAKLKNDLEIYQELYEGKAATKEKVRELQQSYDEAVNQAKQLKEQIADASVKAPISGIISSKSLEAGGFANTGTELTSIVNLSIVKVEVSLTETEAYQVTEGQKVKITTNVYPDKVFTGKLTFISPQADAAHNYAAEIRLENTGNTILRAGTFVYADFSKKLEDSILALPREALMESLQKATVYVVNKDQKVELKEIKTGREIKGQVEVLQGLKKGDVVVTTGQINLEDGTEVRVAN
ncbi:efflux RND transporter periplasmic adaptor subunit [Chondrinema litorale]|uniref:efflux RND transporter periplasmic adaptor subunit n=1 Tax=Chondrinema litorale TaxID=2994555 RepID=UPI0025439E1B|nr:efflux RND transporter periplasmic adaptor subunit [Chondrinema litorale]UZR97769.1 efflux RND transporter periplasmic adaptor subunit [Chondrinema litorale]